MRSERQIVANMIPRSGKRRSHADPFSKQASVWCVQGMRPFKISETQVIKHNNSGVSPTTCEKRSSRSRRQAEAGVFFEKQGFPVRHYLPFLTMSGDRDELARTFDNCWS